MITKKLPPRIFLNSLVLTVLVFAIGLIVSYGMDFLRVDEITMTMTKHSLDTEGYLIEKEFVHTFGGNDCMLMNSRIFDLKKEIAKVGQDLSNYGGKTIFKKKDFDYLKRKYFLLQLNFLTLIDDLNDNCGLNYVPIVFFYRIDDDQSERQGFVLDDYSQAYRTSVVVIALDIEYEDEPLVKLLIQKYNVTKAPTIVINEEVKFEKLTYTGQINATVWQYLKPRVDQFSNLSNFHYTLEASGADVDEYIAGLEELLEENLSYFSRGEVNFVLGRIKSDEELKCSSLQYYFDALGESKEQDALIYETVASIDCGANVRAMYQAAAEIWDELQVSYRAEIDRRLAYRSTIEFDVDLTSIADYKLDAPEYIDGITLGDSGLTVGPDDVIVSQVDRVVRDWLSLQLQNSPYVGVDSSEQVPFDSLLTVMSERLTYNKTELLENIGWHEGARIKDIREIADPHHRVASSTLAYYVNGSWYAPNEEGVFMFEVPWDKIQYPTTRFLREDLALIADTHGINMLVGQAIRYNASVVIGCCDHPDKVKAVLYLSKKNISSICFTDKYLPLLLGAHANALGSPPIDYVEDYALIGYRPINISINEPIIVMNMSSQIFATSYYQTPAIYFTRISRSVDLNLTYVTVDNFYQMDSVTFMAELKDAHVIAARVYNSDDYEKLSSWLSKNETNRAILFHSSAYPYGIKLFNQYPRQTTFDDINPKFWQDASVS